MSPVPGYIHEFFDKYQDRLVYGTDMIFNETMYRETIRILETADEHFYVSRYSYHRPLYGLFLTDKTLKKVYRDNALKITKH